MISIALLYTTIRGDEKLLLEAAKKQHVQLELVDVTTQIFNPNTFKKTYSLALERCVSTTKGTYATTFLESQGVEVINNSKIASICEDKFKTSLALQNVGVPTPKFAVVFNQEQAQEAVEMLGGFPVVLKPVVGSWGRLLAKINDMDALEALIEHKDMLGSPQQKVFYLQEYVKKPGRDIRAFMIDGKVICAIYRQSEHWITNTARGAKATNCPISKELQKIAHKASIAVGGGILALDVFETDSGFTINEINHTMEYKNSEEPTGVSISGEIIAYARKVSTSL